MKRKLLSEVDWVIVGILLFALLLVVAASMSHNNKTKAYNAQCIKVGGTPAFNGEFRECFGVKSKGE